MKKISILAVLALILLPVSAMAGMSVASDADLTEVTGRTGITIDMDMTVDATGIAWGDDDGFTGYASAGWVVMRTVSLPNISLNGVTIDAGGNGTTSYIAIDTGTSPIISGDLTILKLVIGNSATAISPSAGEIRVSGIGIGFGTIKISGH